MKTNTNQITINHLPEKLTEAQAAGQKYRLRAECRYDCTTIRAALRPWLLSWKEAPTHAENQSHIDANGVLWCSQDWDSETEVGLIMAQDGPTLNEIRWLLERLDDCHVAMETLNTAEEYTGERLDFDGSDFLQTCPSREVMNKAMRSIAKFVEIAEMNARSASDAWSALEASRPANWA